MLRRVTLMNQADRSNQLIRELLLFFTAIFASGCGGDGLAQVSGVVTLPDGSTKEGVFVSFSDPDKQRGASGVTDAAGKYQLTTNTPGDGAPPGTYRIAVTQPGPADSSQLEGPRLFPKRYESAQSSGLSFEVKPGKNSFDIQLTKQ